MKLLITGGHVTPALAVIDELKKEKKDVEVIFVGRKYVSDKKEAESMEYKEVVSRGIPFINLTTGRLTRVVSVQSLKHLLKVPIGLFNSLQILLKNKPDIILSFGGYLALPVAFMGYLLRIPVYTHEQTIHPGLANKLIAKVAKKVFISFDDSKQFFQIDKVILTGNPIREQVKKTIEKPFELSKDRPVIYITGGSLGSHSINVHIETILKELLRKYTVIHQVGNVEEFKDFERLQKLRENLHSALKNQYFVKEHVSSNEIGYILSKADIVIGRSGANTFSELFALKIPAIFIPLPWSAHGEQQKQAELFKKWNVGEIFDQDEKSSELLSLITHMIDHLHEYKNNFSKISSTYPHNAAQTIIQTIFA
jgi:UDP-N-acetylglucosamine--N-acetylmuramyl-(pentapeptide) pyrophosphoryl-undecaprenol N-acetylglucosamine transferase